MYVCNSIVFMCNFLPGFFVPYCEHPVGSGRTKSVFRMEGNGVYAENVSGFLISVCMYVCMYVCMDLLYVSMCKNICMYVFIYCMYVYLLESFIHVLF